MSFTQMIKTKKILNKDLQTIKKRDNKRFFKSLIIPPSGATTYCQQLTAQWFTASSDAKLYNFTVNTNPHQLSKLGRTYGKLSDEELYRLSIREITDFMSRDTIYAHIQEILICYEYGEKKGKFHFNVMCKLSPNSDDAHLWYIKNKLKSIFSTTDYGVKEKNQRVFSRPDSYNVKDASMMATLRFNPIHLINKYDEVLMETIHNYLN